MLFKIWDFSRMNKSFIIIAEQEHLLEKVIAKASEKLKINGKHLVLENDGTVIDEDEILIAMQAETIILLADNQAWLSINKMQIVDNIITSNTSEINNLVEPTDQNLEILPSSSMDSVTYISNSEYDWSNFEINWHKLPVYIMKQLNDGEQDIKVKNFVVHFIVSELREIKINITSIAFRTVATKLVNQYPRTFLDVDEDEVIIGNGASSIYLKLKDRNNYLNRPHNNVSSSNAQNKSKNIKKLNSSKAGCVNWGPQVTGQAPISSINQNDPNFVEIMNILFSDQRKFLNETSDITVHLVQQHWPILLTQKGTFHHFEKLTKVNINIMDEQFKNKTNILSLDKNNELQLSNDEETEIKILRVLAWYFKEDINEFYEEIKVNDNFEIFATQPKITKFGQTFYVSFSQEKLNSGYDNFLTAMKVTFALFFNFNLFYQPKLSKVLEFVQRYFLKIHPDIGTKSKKGHQSKNAVILLIKKLNKLTKPKLQKQL